jgi:zinc finger protein CONSTANS
MSSCIVCCAPAKIWCENDKAFLCAGCDLTIHTANSLAAKHTRGPVCDLCFRVAAVTFCKNDSAFLCVECDKAIHLNNPLAARHEVVPAAVAFREQCAGCKGHPSPVENVDQSAAHSETGINIVSSPEEGVACSFDDFTVPDEVSLDNRDETVPNVKVAESQANKGLEAKGLDALELDNSWLDRLDMCFDFSDMMGDDNVVPCLSSDSDFMKMSESIETKLPLIQRRIPEPHIVPSEDHATASKSFCGLTREQRVMRYREKRKRRTFEKTIRYASRKAYAEVRPRIKGRFAKREEMEAVSKNFASFGDEHEDFSDVAVVPDMGSM